MVVNGQTFQAKPMLASVSQGSILGPILWNIYVDDLLQLVPEIVAYADDCTLSHSFKRQDGHLVAAEPLNGKGVGRAVAGQLCPMRRPRK